MTSTPAPAGGRAGQVPGRRTAPFATLSPLLRLLILTQLAFNIGFFAVLPFLAEHLGQSVGMAGWLVGFVLGLRTFSQQGLFVVGGALADRYGIRPVVLAGCVLRIAGFAWLGFAERTWAVVSAVLLIGFAAALFSPAVESEVARQAVGWEEEGAGTGRGCWRCSPSPGRPVPSSGRCLERCCSPSTSVRPASPGPGSSCWSSPGTRGCCRSAFPGGPRSG